MPSRHYRRKLITPTSQKYITKPVFLNSIQLQSEEQQIKQYVTDVKIDFGDRYV